MESLRRRIIRFGTFEADPATGELRKGPREIKLQELPFRVLMALLEHPGDVVTREDLREKLWGDTNVDFEDGLNTAVRKLRDALGDSATNPRFVETLPRRGYRFIAPVETEETPQPQAAVEKKRPPVTGRVYVLTGLAALLLVVAFLARGWLIREQPSWTPSPPIQLTRDSGLTTDPAISRDGRLLAYASDREGGDNLDIWIQHTSAGEARRLASHPADDHQPDISPDGDEVIFRSERDGGGIYAVSSLGGEPRLLVKKAYVPRFSPDGSRIAYSIGSTGSGGFWGKLHVFSSADGSSRTLAPELMAAGPPAWSPDGTSIVFAGARFWTEPPTLWVCSADGGPATRMSPRPISQVVASVGQIRTISIAWFEDQIIVSAKQGDSSNLWTGAISPRTHELLGDLKRVTFGSGNEWLPSVSSGGKLVFANHSYAADIWEATTATGVTGAGMRRLTHDRALNYRPSVSGDGSKLVYVSNRSGNFDVWVMDLASGKESALTRTPAPELFAALSRDGKHVAFGDGEDIYVAPVSGGPPRLLYEKFSRPFDWSADGRVVGRDGSRGPALARIAAWDPATGKRTLITDHPTLISISPHMSPDGNWRTFHTSDQRNRQVLLAPYTGSLIPEAKWTAVTDGQALDREPVWSSQGDAIYFLSDRDGVRCIWARKLDPRTKQPVGSIYPAVHLHNPRLSLMHIPDSGHVSLCSVGEKLIFAMAELTGNIWMTELRRN